LFRVPERFKKTFGFLATPDALGASNSRTKVSGNSQPQLF
jgi:hypothetical protein